MILFLLIILTSVNNMILCTGIQLDQDDLRMVVEFIKHSENPMVINAKVNWSISKKADLISLISKAEDPILLKFIETLQLTKDVGAVPHDNLFLVDLQCPDIDGFLEKANLYEKFRLPYKWLFIDNENNSSEIVPDALQEINILFDSEILIAKRDENDDYKLHFIYRKIIRGRWYTEYFGTWTKTDGLLVSKMMTITTSMRRKDFEKVPILTSMVINHENTKIDISDLRNNAIDTPAVSGYRQTVYLFDFMNATRTIIYSDTWGYYINGSWTGMTGHLERGDADLGGVVIFINKQRIDVLEYIIRPMKSVIRFVFRRPPLSYQNNLLLLPFKTNVWICIGVFVLIYISLIYLSSKWEVWKLKFGDKDISDNTMLRPNLGDVTLFVISAITQQGAPSELKGSLGRLVMLILFIAFLFIYTSYSACIVALLQSSSNNIRTLSDLLNSRLELGVEDISYNRYYFSTATEPIRKAIYETKIAPKGSKPNFMSIEEGVKRMQKEPFAFHMNTAIGYIVMNRFFYEHEKCGLQEIAFILDTKPWFACRKKSPYKEIFKIGLRRLEESGVIERENVLVYPSKPVCYSVQATFASVTIRDCYLAFLVLLYGLVLSVFIMFMEILMHRRRKISSSN